jgi:hypothetical protein
MSTDAHSTFELVAQWCIFTAPLSKVVQLEVEKNAPLYGCALCVSRDGTIAVIVVDGFQLYCPPVLFEIWTFLTLFVSLYLVPGSAAPLTRVCLRGKDLLLIYADHHGRLWDSQTKELRRSMRQDKAEEMMSQGGWVTSCVLHLFCQEAVVLTCFEVIWEKTHVFRKRCGVL